MTRVEYDLWSTDEDVEIVITHDHPVELDQSTTIVKANPDGLIIDFYQNGELTGTIGMTYEEWFDFSQRDKAAQP
jgi:hypothetical protein